MKISATCFNTSASHCDRHLLVAATRLTLIVASICVMTTSVVADDQDLFESHVRPMLVANCIKCHGDAKQEGGLRLTKLEELLRGGESGAAIVPGKPNESLLLEAVRYESIEMPPGGQLKNDVVEGIAKWIKAGARWPNRVVLQPTAAITDEDRDWWCYQPLAAVVVPIVDDHGWCRNEIDRFVFDRLWREGLAPSEAAEPSILVRRVHFAITGLPPAEPAASTITERDDWYEALVSRLLEDSAYGENQARYWLDLVRYADSDGYNADHSRPEARHYRDYVIRSFNEDKPYDRFVLEQLAGDEIDPGNRDALLGTMYLRHWIYEYNQRDVEGQWAQIINDVTETTSDVFLAQGIKCARCHDHKFDPLLQRDYYALRAFFEPLLPREDQPVADVKTRAKHLQQQRIWESATEDIRHRLHEIEMPVLLAHAGGQGFGKFTKEIQSFVANRRSEISPYEHQIASLTRNQLELNPDKLPEWLDKAKESERQQLRAKLAEFDHLKPKPLPTVKFVVSDVGPVAPPTIIPDTADPKPIAPAFPVIMAGNDAEIKPPHKALQSTGRRSSLARWITNKDNPLTARVIVNRVWQQHFGRGLVETTSDFGRLGSPPSHPELLDWLAQRFMADGWSFKKLHHLILTSATYRQSSRRPLDPKLAKLDPQNALLWRMNPRRLSGEEIHDTVVSACGDMSAGKRAIYKPVKRNALDPLLAAFDFPDRVESQCKRHRTTTSPQSLLMMNDPWLHERAKKMASDIGETRFDSLVQAAYHRLFFREPTPGEIDRTRKFVESYESGIEIRERPARLASMRSGGSAIVVSPKRPTSIQVAPIKELYENQSDGDFTIEATVRLHSLYPDASVRTIVAGWAGKKSERGWSLGVTSTKSAYQPRNLILQFVGSRDDKQSKAEYEVIPSNLRVELNKPYHVAVSIDLDNATDKGITFYLKDLTKPDADPQIAHVAHKARWSIQSNRSIEIGGRSQSHFWDGLVQSVRLHQGTLSRDELFSDNAARDRLLFDVQFSDEARPGSDHSGKDRHALITEREASVASPAQLARIALLHALLCSNEVIYVD